MNDGGTYRGWYNYRTGSAVLKGIRYAESTDGKTWTKYSSNVISNGSAGSIDFQYLEHHQVFKYQNVYWMVYECYNGSVWRNALAYSTTYNGTFTKLGSALDPSISGWDNGSIATPFMYQNPGSGEWLLMYEGGNTTVYTHNMWDLGLVSEYDLSGGVSSPVASFTVNRNMARIPQSITVTDTSTNTPTSWQWSWGDGTSNSTSQNPTHLYTKRGRFEIYLTATNAGGSGTTATATIVRVIGYENYD
jgi:PKD repeat protein